MSYLRADDILPQELIRTIQQYVNGKAIYIPSIEKQKWGSKTDTKAYLNERNAKIFELHQKGIKSSDLASQYALSEKSIQRIIRKIKTGSFVETAEE